MEWKKVIKNIFLIAAVICSYFLIWNITFWYTLGPHGNKMFMAIPMLLVAAGCAGLAYKYHSLFIAIFGLGSGFCSLFSFSGVSIFFAAIYLLIIALIFLWLGYRKSWRSLMILTIIGLIFSTAMMCFLYIVGGASRFG